MALILPIILLEPAMVTFTGGTIGHHIRKIKVRKIQTDENINFIFATLRFLLKVLLGWLSLILVLTSKKHQAAHDIFARSIVVNKSPNNLPANESLEERIIEEEGFKYPSKLIRAMVISLYIVLSFTFIIAIVYYSISFECLDNNQCGLMEGLLIKSVNIIWLLLVGVIVVLGWKAKLFGCRKKPVDVNLG